MCPFREFTIVQKESDYNPFSMYSDNGPEARQRFVKWFHNNRLADFADWIEPANRMLSVGSGNAELESKKLRGRFNEIYTLEVHRGRSEIAFKKNLKSVQASAPPLPFKENTFDAVMAAGAIEHLPDERGFLEDAARCLRPNGDLYLTLPIEVGVGGLLRHLGKNFVHPDRGDSPEGIERYWDYSREELFKLTPREKHGTAHRYYNYVYAINDVKDIYSDVSIRGWPAKPLGTLNLILYVKSTNPS